jgi:hypothetical protein
MMWPVLGTEEAVELVVEAAAVVKFELSVVECRIGAASRLGMKIAQCALRHPLENAMWYTSRVDIAILSS